MHRRRLLATATAGLAGCASGSDGVVFVGARVVEEPGEGTTVVNATTQGLTEIRSMRRAFEQSASSGSGDAMVAVSPRNRSRIGSALDDAGGDGPTLVRYDGRVYRVYFAEQD